MLFRSEQIIQKWFTTSYEPKKGRGRRRASDSELTGGVPFLVQVGEEIFVNPYAFSWTVSFGKGYPTYPFKLSDEQLESMGRPKTCWISRLPVHGVIWRWAHGHHDLTSGIVGYPKIVGDMEISHVGDDPWVVSLWRLVAECGVYNRSRSACMKYGWYAEYRSGVLRCPHEPPCKPSPVHPELSFFRVERASLGLALDLNSG